MNLTEKQTRNLNKQIVKSTDCWLWRGCKSHGYASFRVGKKQVSVHRLMFEMYTGKPIPKGLEIDHKCCVKNCVNPDHLQAVTHGVNMDLYGDRKFTHCARGHKFKARRDSERRRCGVCKIEYMKIWHKNNPRDRTAYRRMWRAKRRELGLTAT